MSTIAAISLILARKNVPQIIPGIMALIFFGLFCNILLWIGYTYGSIVLFIYPLLAIIILGLKAGMLLSLALFIAICFFVFIPGLSKIQYELNSAVQILLNYLVVLSITIVIENTRISKDKVINRQKQELEKFNKNLQDIVNEKTLKVIKLQNAILKTMSNLVEYRDYVTGEHIERTQYGVNLLLDEIKKQGLFKDTIDNWEINLLLQSAQLHDVGKIAISDQILKKPGPLTKDEYEEMKKHAVFGLKIIERIETDSGESDLLNHAKVFALTHHEKWDGPGYPNGIKGEKIPLEGRIMAIADVYDALVSERPYKKAFTHEQAAKIIIEGKGTQFDPVLIDLFINICNRYEYGQ
jgi:putative two-component system response regulator